jgi:hypothetical protein
MKKIFNLLAATLVCLVLNQTTTLASSHREAPLISFDPLADNTDLYAFRSPQDSSKIILMANYIPFEHPAGGPNWYSFGENIRYEIHVKNKQTNPTVDDIVYRFTFTKVIEDSTTFFRVRLGKENLRNTYTLERSVNGGAFTTIVTNGIVPAPNIGPRSIENPVLGINANPAYGGNVNNYDSIMFKSIKTATTGEKVYAGPIDDPFFVDLGAVFDLGATRSPGRDGLAKFNCHSLVLEVPISTLQKDGKTTAQATSILDPDFVIGVYANASRQAITTFDSATARETTSGSWIQVSRLGMPLTNEVIVPIGFKDLWNAVPTNNEAQFDKYFKNPELALYMDNSQYGPAIPGLSALRIQTNSLGAYDFRNGKQGLYPLKGTAAVTGTALDDAVFGTYLLPDNASPRSVDLLPIFQTGVPNLRPYQLATGKPTNNPLAAGKPFINNFLPTFGDMLRLNMAVPVTPRTSADFSSDGLIAAAVLGLTDARFNGSAALQNIPNMDGFPNGRRLEDDVTRIELQAVGGVVLAALGLWYDDYTGSGSPVTTQLSKALSFTAGPTANDTTFKTVFPFAQAPWRGFIGAGYVGPTSVQTLPVTFVNFTADKSGEKVVLHWQVTNELNNSYYEIERSNGNGTYTKIGTVTAQGGGATSSYQFVDANPTLAGSNFYRIKQVDKDGRYSYTPIRLIKFDTRNIFTVTPNPATNFINIYTSDLGLRINLFDANGKKVASNVMSSGSLQLSLSGLSKGIYMIVAEKDGVRVQTTRIVKQ